MYITADAIFKSIAYKGGEHLIKKLKRYFLRLCVFALCMMPTSNSFAYSLKYTVGDIAMTVPVQSYNDGVNVTDENEFINIKNGFVSFEIHCDFDYEKINVEYACLDAVNVTVSVNGVDTVCTLQPTDDDKTESIVLNRVVFGGYSLLKISTDNEISIKCISLNKKEHSVSNTIDKAIENINFGEYGTLIQSALIIADNTSLIRAGGAARYINYNNFTQKPVRLNGNIYVPVKMAAYALKLYCESDGAEYAVIRNNDFELKYENDMQTLQKGTAYPNVAANAFFVQDNIINVNVNLVAELLNLAVYDNNGIFIADRKDRLENIISKIKLVKQDFNYLSNSSDSCNVYYVSQQSNASDSNPGTFDLPFGTIKKAAEVAHAGDTVIIRGGTYRETLIPKNNGKPSEPIIFKAADGEKVTISALEKIKCEPQKENRILCYDISPFLGDGRNQVFYNNKPLCQARYPNKSTDGKPFNSVLDMSDLWPVKGNIKISADDKYTAESEFELNQDDNFWQGADLISMQGSGWGLCTAKISESAKGSLKLDSASIAKEWWYAYDEQYSNGDYAYITNTKNAIDVPGEWYWGDKLYVYPISDDMTIEAKARQTTIDLRNKDCIQIIGIDTIGGGITTDESFLCVINGGEHKYISHYTHSKDQHYGYVSDGNVFNKNGEPRNGEMGFYLGGDSNAIINTNIKYSAASGIYAAGKYGYIENNFIQECGYMGSYASGIFICAAYDEISEDEYKSIHGGFGIYNNTVSKCGRAALEVSANEKFFSKYGLALYAASDIAYNEFCNSSLLARDTGTVYIHGSVMGSELKKTTIRSNVIYNDFSDAYNCAMYFDNYSQMIECYDNTVLEFCGISDYKKAINVQQGLNGDGGTFADVDVWNNRYYSLPEDYFFNNEFNKSEYRYGYCENSSYKKRFSHQSSFWGTCDMAVVSGGTQIVNNDVLFNSSGQSVQYSNVKFGLLDNGICIEYTGDKYNPNNTIEISVDGDLYSSELNVQAENDMLLNYAYIPLNVSGEKHNITVTSKTDNIFKIRRLIPCNINSDIKSSGNIMSKCYAGNYDAKYHSDKYVNRFLTREIYDFDNGNKCLYQTYGNASILYKNVAIPKSAKYAVVAMSTGTKTSQIVKLCLNSQNGKEIFSGLVPCDGWYSESIVKYPLSSDINYGTYDVYMNISGLSDTDILWFGFCSDADYMTDENIPLNIMKNSAGIMCGSNGEITKVFSNKSYIEATINKEQFLNKTQAYIDVTSNYDGYISVRMLQSPYSVLAKWNIKGGKDELRYWSKFDWDKLKSGDNSVIIEFNGKIIAKNISINKLGFTNDNYTDRVYNVLFDYNADYTQVRITSAPSVWKQLDERKAILAMYRNKSLVSVGAVNTYDFKNALSIKLMNYSYAAQYKNMNGETEFLPQWNDAKPYSAKLFIWSADGLLKPIYMKEGVFAANN